MLDSKSFNAFNWAMLFSPNEVNDSDTWTSAELE
jgi:hypothetical protein